MAKILILTSVIGGGHVFRDVAIARALESKLPGAEVVFASGGHAYEMLKEEQLNVEQIAALRFPAHMGTAQFFTLYLAILWSELLQLFDLRRLIKKHRPDLVVLDEFFFLADYCRLRKIPVVFMCDFVGVPSVGLFPNPIRAGLERFFDWFLAKYLPRRVERWIYIGEQGLIPNEDWRARAQAQGILSVGSITKLQYSPPLDRLEARRRFGFAEDAPVISVAIGCSGVGAYLLEAANAAAPLVRAKHPNARFELVCGKGLEPDEIRAQAAAGVSVHGYLKDIENLYAASDVAVVQCGLTTTTECLQLGLPMIIVPLANHWEQANTARYLETQGARRIQADALTAQRLAEEINAALAQPPTSRGALPQGHVQAAEAIIAALKP